MTLKDVALKANCSVATVSKALKNSSEISEDAKQRILAVAKESGYLKKATTRSAVLGGLKTVIFNDISGENTNLYFEIQKLAKKYGLITIYISVSEKDSLELLNQLGAFGLILKGDNLNATNEKVFALQNSADEAKEFLNEISDFMPKRPSRAVSMKGKKTTVTQKSANKKSKVKANNVNNNENKGETAHRKEEIWLL